MQEKAAWSVIMEDITDSFMQWKHARDSPPAASDIASRAPSSPPLDSSASPCGDNLYTWRLSISLPMAILRRLPRGLKLLSPSPLLSSCIASANASLPLASRRLQRSCVIIIMYVLFSLSSSHSNYSHQIPYCPYLCLVYASTFEVYLHIIRNIEGRIHGHLSWDSPE